MQNFKRLGSSLFLISTLVGCSATPYAPKALQANDQKTSVRTYQVMGQDAVRYVIDFNGSAKALIAKLSAAEQVALLDEEAGLLTVLSTDPAFLERAKGLPGVADVAADKNFSVVHQLMIKKPEAKLSVQSAMDPLEPAQWSLRQIQAQEAWQFAKGKGVRVAVVDTGVDPNNPDLAANLDLASGGSVIDYGPDKDVGVLDLMGHGSHVAGIIAAAQNGFGVVGVAPEATIVPIKAATWDGHGTVGDAIAGIKKAIKARVQVMNLSLQFSFDPDNAEDVKLAKSLKKAIHFARAKGILVVSSAGNSSLDLDENPSLPVSIGPNLGVSATGPVGQQNFDGLGLYSNYGHAVDLCAPGGNIGFDANGVPVLVNMNDLVLSTWSMSALPQYFMGMPIGASPFMYMIGTSQAAPHVAGTAALILSAHPKMSVNRLMKLLEETADDLGAPGYDVHFGHGRINANQALCRSK